VIAMEDWVTIKTLKSKNPKLSYREIARLIGVSHHTVKTALERDGPPCYQRAVAPNPHLDPFREVIFEMANVKRFRGSRILEEIRSKGYTGGKTAVYRLLSQLKIESAKECTPYETPPGRQSQFDWSPYTVLIGGMLTQVVVFSYINGFSRFQVFDGSLSQDQGAVFEAMENGFAQSGGVPHQVQTDNAKVFVKNASRTNFQWNQRYLHFCGHYGFEPSRSLPGHPWSKGKVEKPFQYLETHFIAGASFVDMLDFLTKLKEFQHKVNSRVHATIKTAPEELISKDREAFSALPATRYVGVKEETRKVTSDCLISYGGSRYSVPWPFATKHVWVRLSKGYFLEVYSQANALVACHKLSLKSGAVVIEKSHYRTPASTSASIQRLRLVFRERFPNHELFLEKLLAQKRINSRYHLSEILQIAHLYGHDDFALALDACLEYNVFSVRFISGFLEKNFQQAFDLSRKPSLQQGIPVTSGLQRDLAEYRISTDELTQTRDELPFTNLSITPATEGA
jgi:transposase